MSAAGNKPVIDPKTGKVLGPITRDIMADPGQSLQPREALAQGVGKAHRQVVYANFDFRNFGRSYLGTQGKL